MAAFIRSLFDSREQDDKPHPDPNAYEELLHRLLDFDDLVELETDTNSDQVFELTNAELLVPFVTIKFKQGQYVFHEQKTHSFCRVELHVEPVHKHLRFMHDDETWTWVDPMLWSQYLQSKESREDSLRIHLPARTHRNQFCYHRHMISEGGHLYTNVFLKRALRTINGSTIESGGNIRMVGNFIVLSDGDMCPLPRFSVPALVFGAEGWLGVGVRGCDPISTDRLAAICQACSRHFGAPLTVVPLDINDSIIPCDGCDDESQPCVCKENKKRMLRFSFISHLCLLHNSRDVPYGDLAAGLWISMPESNKVAITMQSDTVTVLSDF